MQLHFWNEKSNFTQINYNNLNKIDMFILHTKFNTFFERFWLITSTGVINLFVIQTILFSGKNPSILCWRYYTSTISLFVGWMLPKNIIFPFHFPFDLCIITSSKIVCFSKDLLIWKNDLKDNFVYCLQELIVLQKKFVKPLRVSYL